MSGVYAARSGLSIRLLVSTTRRTGYVVAVASAAKPPDMGGMARANARAVHKSRTFSCCLRCSIARTAKVATPGDRRAAEELDPPGDVHRPGHRGHASRGDAHGC